MAEVSSQEISQVLSDIVNRIRSLEAKYNILGERLLIVNQNMISQFKKDTTEVKALNAELKEIRTELFKTKETMKDLMKGMQFFATKEDIKVLEKYINLWNPLKFITQEDLEKAIQNEHVKKRYRKKDGRRSTRSRRNRKSS